MAGISPKVRQPGRGVGLFLALFGLPFLLVGLGMGWRTLSQLHDFYRAKKWVETTAFIRTLELRVSGGESDTYQVICHYPYEFNGQKYEGKRVGILSGADNVDGWQQRTHKRLEPYFTGEEPVPCYVNPKNPSESLLDRELRFNMLTFGLVFATVFGGVGFGMVASGLYIRRRARFDTVADAPPDQPWLQRKDWAAGVLKSGHSATEVVLWVIAIFLTFVSWPPLMALPEELTRGRNLKALWILVFPLVSLIPLSLAIRSTLRRRKFGQSYLHLTTIPGVIGGHLRGTLVLAGALEGLDRVQVELKCVRSYTTGSGDNRHTHTDTLWSDGFENEPATRFGQTQIEVPLDFQIPYDCRPVDLSNSSDTIQWKLRASGEMPGVDLWLDFDVPVFKTPASSATVRESTQRIAQQRAVVASDENPLPHQLHEDADVQGVKHYTVSCWPGLAFFLIWLVCGLLTAGVAIFAYTQVAKGEKFFLIFLIAFGLFSLLMLFVLISCLGHFSITLIPNAIQVRRSFGPLARTRTINASDVSAIETKECASSNDKKWYAIYCRTGRLGSYPLATNIPGLVPAQWLTRRIEEHIHKPA